MARPGTLPRWATDGGAQITTPSSGAQDIGHIANTALTAGLMNWFWNLVYQWADFLDDATNGTASDTRINSSHAGYSDAPFELSRSASDDSASWKLLLRGKITSTRTWSVWLAASGSSTRAVIVTNATWNGSAWELQDSAQIATALEFTTTAGVLTLSRKASGSPPWTSWDRGSIDTHDVNATGDVFCDDITASGDIAASGTITAEASITTEAVLFALNVVASGFMSADGNISAGGNMSAIGNVSADGDVTAGSAALFQYGSSGVSRTVQLRLAEVALNADFKYESGGGSLTPEESGISRTAGGTATISIPLKLPHGATLTGVQLQVNQGSGAIIFNIYKRVQTDYGATPANPVVSNIGNSAQSNATTGDLITWSMGGTINETINNATTEYVLDCTFGATDQHLVAARVTFTDPGPRNH